MKLLLSIYATIDYLILLTNVITKRMFDIWGRANDILESNLNDVFVTRIFIKPNLNNICGGNESD